MTQTETQAIVTLSLMAAFVDGDKHDRERAEVRRIAEGLAQSDAVHLPTLVQDVLMKRVDLAGTAAALRSADTRQLAYEMAVCVCDADGVQSLPEQKFLEQLRSTLGLDAGRARQFTEDAESVAAAPIAGPVPAPGGSVEPPPVPTAGVAGVGVGVRTPNVSEQELDQTILNAAITNGALELLPETLSTMAIIPLQMRLVYRIGQAYGYELDSGHVKDFLATVGVGLTSQYLEQAGRKLLGGLLGRVAGGLGRGIVQRGLQLLQRCVQRGALLRIQHLQQLLLACARLRQDAARQRAAGGGDRHDQPAAVGRIGFDRDQRLCAEGAQQPPRVRLVHRQRAAQRGQLHGAFRIQPCQHAPLGHRQAVRTCVGGADLLLDRLGEPQQHGAGIVLQRQVGSEATVGLPGAGLGGAGPAGRCGHVHTVIRSGRRPERVFPAVLGMRGEVAPISPEAKTGE